MPEGKILRIFCFLFSLKGKKVKRLVKYGIILILCFRKYNKYCNYDNTLKGYAVWIIGSNIYRCSE